MHMVTAAIGCLGVVAAMMTKWATGSITLLGFVHYFLATTQLFMHWR